MRALSALISDVTKGSLAWKHRIKPGWTIETINGEPVYDILEYRFFCSEESVVLELLTNKGKKKKVKIKNKFEDLGILFENPLIDTAKSCRNKCVFCFIDQLPSGMRETLYFKDDDSRLSFLHGNYVTLTNMSMDDLKRVVKARISPLNVSVQATDPQLRCKLLNNRFAGDLMDKMRYLADNKITMNCQIVCCKGLNDGKAFLKSVRELASLYPYVASISAVPVGITRYREGLYPLEPYEKEDCISFLNQLDELQEEMLETIGTRLIFAGDEFYLKAERPLPDASEYEGFPQIENGVGMISSFRDEFYEVVEELELTKTEISIATGRAAYSLFTEFGKELERRGVKTSVYAIENKFFGELITVSGLITGGDLVAQLQGKPLGNALLISRNMLKADEDIFLDDMTLEQAQESLGVPIVCVEDSGYDFLEKIKEIGESPCKENLL